ncbi:MAG: hypothetical protein E6J47_06195 [Chloroflexi bacterium]|nr:MAG: hypothetical protein E6J47_06195 [Chloroflexota bacterium]
MAFRRGGGGLPPGRRSPLTGAVRVRRQRGRCFGTLLPDGRVLVTGGLGGPELASAEICDPGN